MTRTHVVPTDVIAGALRTLGQLVDSEDGVASAALYQAAARLEEQAEEIKHLRGVKVECERWKERCQYNANTAHDVAAQRDALAAELQAIKEQWISVSERMPEPNKKVLATYTNRLGNTRRVIAEFVAKHAVECRDEDWGGLEEYDELTDRYFCPEGWYERAENWGELSHLFIDDGEITHWMPLPDAPEGELK